MRTEFVNLDKLFDPKRVITNHNPLTKDKKFSPDGLFSEDIFSKYANDNEMLSYQCECGKYKGKFLNGFICDECKNPVKYTVSKLNKLAWIDLGKYYIINPTFYYLISKFVGRTEQLNSIISYSKKLSKDGIIQEDEEPKKSKTVVPFQNIGLVEFKEKFFLEGGILQTLYKRSKYKEKDELYNLILRHHDKVFINKIPVFDTMLRPATITTFKDKPVFKFDEITNSYNFIIRLAKLINKKKDFELIVLPNLYTIQSMANIAYSKIIENLAGKYGFIRSSLLGTRLNQSARGVITPLPRGHNVDDIIIPHIIFIELYSFHLMNMLCKLKNISMIEAQKYIFDAIADKNETVNKLCDELIEKTKHGLLVLSVRNPTIARGSMLCQRIIGKKDPTDLTISISNSILALINGDYDGDAYNLFPIMDNEYKRYFYKIFSPINMFISNNNGKFNTRLSLDRDQVIGMYQYNKFMN